MTLFKWGLSFVRNGIKMGGQRERDRRREERRGEAARRKERARETVMKKTPRGEISRIEMST